MTDALKCGYFWRQSLNGVVTLKADDLNAGYFEILCFKYWIFWKTVTRRSLLWRTGILKAWYFSRNSLNKAITLRDWRFKKWPQCEKINKKVNKQFRRPISFNKRTPIEKNSITDKQFILKSVSHTRRGNIKCFTIIKCNKIKRQYRRTPDLSMWKIRKKKTNRKKT